MYDRTQQESSKWWRVSLRAKGVAVLVPPIAALFAALFSVYWIEADVRGAEQSVVRLYELRGELGALRSSLLDAGSAISGYSATGEARFLASYSEARKSIEGALEHSATQTGADREGMQALAGIQRLTGEELRLLDQMRDLGPHSKEAAALMERERAVRGDLQSRIALLGGYEKRRFADDT